MHTFPTLATDLRLAQTMWTAKACNTEDADQPLDSWTCLLTPQVALEPRWTYRAPCTSLGAVLVAWAVLGGARSEA
jgi:hypothetical protein